MNMSDHDGATESLSMRSDLPPQVLHLFAMIRGKPDYAEIKSGWVFTDEGIEVRLLDFARLGRSPTLILQELKTHKLFVRHLPSHRCLLAPEAIPLLTGTAAATRADQSRVDRPTNDGETMDAQRRGSIALPQSVIRGRLQQIHECARLAQLEEALIQAISRPKKGGKVAELQQLGVKLFPGVEGIECLGRHYRFDREFVWLEKSDVIGLELSVTAAGDKLTPYRCLALIYIRSDEKALIVDVDGEFTRGLNTPDDLDATAAAFLARAVESAVEVLGKAPY